MARHPILNQANLSGSKPVQGTEMTEQFASQAHPIHSQVRRGCVYRLNSVSTNATEMFIDGLTNFRLKGIDSSTVCVTGQITYTTGAAADSCVFNIVAAFFVAPGGAMTLLGAPSVTKFGTSAAAVALTVHAPTQTLAVTVTGAGAGGYHNWVGQMLITESTDFAG